MNDRWAFAALNRQLPRMLPSVGVEPKEQPIAHVEDNLFLGRRRQDGVNTIASSEWGRCTRHVYQQ